MHFQVSKPYNFSKVYHIKAPYKLVGKFLTALYILLPAAGSVMAATSATVASRVQMDDGAQLNVKILGDDPTLKKPLLIALHGAPGVSTLSEPVESFGFLSNHFRVLVYDARGSGESDSIGPFDHDRWTQDIENLR